MLVHFVHVKLCGNLTDDQSFVAAASADDVAVVELVELVELVEVANVDVALLVGDALVELFELVEEVTWAAFTAPPFPPPGPCFASFSDSDPRSTTAVATVATELLVGVAEMIVVVVVVL